MLFFDQLHKGDPQLRGLAWAITSGLAVLFAGLWYVQVVSARDFHEEQHNQSYRTIRLPSQRGKILDRNGLALADNRPSYNLSLYLEDEALREQFRHEYQRLRGTRPMPAAQKLALARAARYQVVSNAVLELARILQQPVGLSEAQFHRHYERSLALPLPILPSLTVTQIARFQECPSNPPGLDMDVQPTRVYPYGSTAAHVLGYLVRDSSSYEEEESFFNYRLPDYAGFSGLELSYNDELRGRAGAKSVLVNSLGYRQSERIWSPVAAGESVVLTLDVGLQQAAEKALHDVRSDGAETRGAVVVLDVRNGDILALCSAPRYDPNMFVRGWTMTERQHWTNELLGVQHNRAINGGYAPGSIFKIVTGLAALEAGWSPTNVVECPGYAQVGRRIIRCKAPGEHDFKSGFKRSCNRYFIECAINGAGADRILALAQRFHLGERTGVPLRSDSPGLLPTHSWQSFNKPDWRDGDTANLSIGQGELLVTPLQEAVMIGAVANGGKVFWPRLVQTVRPLDAPPEAAGQTVPAGRLRDTLPVSARNLQVIREAMLADVEETGGTGRGAAVLDFRVCGKTGTAEVKQGNTVVDRITWFASFGPFESPRYAVVVMVVSGGSGGGTCAPVAQKIYRELQRREHLPGASNPANMASLR